MTLPITVEACWINLGEVCVVLFKGQFAMLCFVFMAFIAHLTQTGYFVVIGI